MYQADADQRVIATEWAKKIILLACTLGILCACNGHNKQNEKPVESAAVAGTTVVFGYLPTAEHNQSYQRGLSVALEEANNKKITLGGQPVHFVWQTASRNQIQSLTHTLSNTKWHAILGQISPKTAAIVQKKALPAVSLAIDSGDTVQTADKAGSTVFHVWPTLNQQGRLIAGYLHQQHIQKIAIVNRGRLSGLVRALQEQWQMKGQSTSTYILERFSQKELHQLMAQLAADKPDLVFYGGDAISAAQLVKRLQQNQLLIPLMMTAGACEATFIRQAGQFAPGSMAVVAGLSLPQMKSSQNFTAMYQQKYHQQPNAVAVYAYDAAWVIITAMKIADSADPQIYLPKLRTLKMSTGLLSGSLTFDNNGVRNEVAMTIYQVEEDKWTVADTISADNVNQTDATTH